MSELLRVSASPHIRNDEKVNTIMADVLIALIFPFFAAVYLFGYRSMLLTFVSVAACMVFEFLTNLLLKRENSLTDLSAVVTGVLLAFNLSPAAPLWLPVAGAFFAIVVVKQIFGGLGSNFVNPALAARVFLLSWSHHMTTFVKPVYNVIANITPGEVDTLATATPLSSLKNGEIPELSLLQLLFGDHGGTIGEVSALLLVAGGLYLLVRKVITWHIPVTYIGTVALVTFLFPRGENALEFMLYEVLTGGLLLGAFFMATDYVTSPVTGKGKLIFGIGCGLLTVMIRYFGGYNEGVAFSILLMNLLVFPIDKLTKKRRFGHLRRARKYAPAKKHARKKIEEPKEVPDNA